MDQPAAGGTDMARLFRKFYGLDKTGKASSDLSKALDEAHERFQSSLKTWMAAIDFVPRSEHLALKEKYEALKETTSRQEDTIKRLKKAIREKDSPQTDAIRGFTELMETQASQFQELMENLGSTFRDGTEGE